MRIAEKRSRTSRDENIVPMINVVFLLLIFFLLAGTISPQPPLDIEPVTTAGQPPAEAPTNGLYVSQAGELYFQGSTLDITAVPAIVAPAVAAKTDPFEVIVDRRLMGEKLFAILEALSRAKVSEIRLVTERREP